MAAVAVSVAAAVLSGTAAVPATAAGPARTAAVAVGGPTPKYDCNFTGTNDARTGAYQSASAIGWEGNHQGVVTCLGGVFLVQDGLYQNYGFGIYHGEKMTWVDADGYLPAQITTFHRDGAEVAITEYCDRVVIGGDAYVAVYSRVAVTNPTGRPLLADPDPSPGLIPLGQAPDTVPPHKTVDHDYVVAADRFGNDYPWPTTAALAAAGGFDEHFAHMERFWNQQLSTIAQVDVPDQALVDAYRSGFIYTQIARSGNDLDTGVNNYDMEYNHDVVGILSNLLTQGYFADARTLLISARDAIVTLTPGQAYQDGTWLYPVPWAVYLEKTGDLSFVKANFDTEGPLGVDQPSIEDAAHDIAAARSGPTGIMEATDDIDTVGYWTTDDFSALIGLAAYRYVATRIGDSSEAAWATQQYDSLLAALDTTLTSTITKDHLDYLPCSLLEPNTANRCDNPEDANWTSPMGSWAWTAYLLGAEVTGPGATMIDATYAYGFSRLKGKLPQDTFGGFPDDYYSTAYNATMGTDGLASKDYRDQGILSYEFMIENSQAGPDSWWESSTAPSTTTPWIGRHPAKGGGSSPHAWGIAGANGVLLASLVTERTDGTLIVGRGVPPAWVRGTEPISVENFPTTEGKRLSLTIAPKGNSVSLSVRGRTPKGILFQLPSFVGNIASTTTGQVDEQSGTVALKPETAAVTVRLRHGP
jgi:hypothetical protein